MLGRSEFGTGGVRNVGISKLRWIWTALYISTGAIPTLGQCPLRQKLTASDASAGDAFGYRVGLSGDTAIVGAQFDDDAGTDSGAAYVFVRVGGVWIQQAKLTASDAAAGDSFGISVAVSGDTAVVGTGFDDNAGGIDAGSAYVFVRSGTVWTQQAKLTASDAAAGDAFGESIAISGGTAVVGAGGDDGGAGTNVGSAYVFVRSGTVWTQQQKLTASDAAMDDSFGHYVAVSGETAVISADRDDNAGGIDAGAAYVFVRSGTVWTQQQKLTAPDGAAGDSFGGENSVAVSGDTAVIGAHRNDHAGGVNAGAAYVFVRSGTVWTQQQKLTASDATAGDEFGYSVSVDGETAVVGAEADDDAGTDSGSVYMFIRSGSVWTQQQKLIASDAAAGDVLGYNVFVSGETVFVGAPHSDDAGADSGSAYMFQCTTPAIPTVSQWGLIAMIGLVAAAGGSILYKRRRILQ